MPKDDRGLRAANQAVVMRYIDATNAWDSDAIADLLAPDFRMEIGFPTPGMASRCESPEEFLSFFRSVQDFILEERLHDVRIDTLFADPGRLIATYKSDMTLIKPAGSYKNSYVTLFEVVDGKITYVVDYFDPIRLVEALGGSVTIPA